ncbi:GFA family protein [Rhodoblastus sp.]|jgi:hypothetical protein|uniref:GFA family protein n=1 Tax=Rhodoblastus sp. TaxID=1962975 RepID=UPI00262513EE|nr:GFA family protein [Rhodoblastus sp.]
MRLTYSCRCGSSRVAVDGEPIGRFICHCLICQAVYKKPFADVTVFDARAVSPIEPHSILFKKYRRPPAVDRGLCSNCGDPVVGFLSAPPLPRRAFVPSKYLEAEPLARAPLRHIFYHRRVRDVADDIPKISGYWPSELFLIGMIYFGLFRR